MEIITEFVNIKTHSDDTTKNKSTNVLKSNVKMRINDLWYMYILLSAAITTANTQAPEFLVHPVSVNTIDGTTVQFTCVANNSPTVFVFLVNGTSVIGDDLFMELPLEDLGSGLRRRRLLVTASVVDNNTQIQCQAIDSMLTGSLSDIAILLVQGPLSSVVDLSYSFIDSSTVNISWSPPFTLPGTNITGYNISVTSNETTTNYFTSDSYYVLFLTNNEISSCVLNIFVFGYNRLNGAIDFIHVPTFQPAAPISVIIDANLSTIAALNVTKKCVDHYSAVNFTLSLDMEIVHSSILMVNNSLDDIKILLVIKEDNIYTLSVSFSFFGYQSKNQVSFDTFGVESVTVTQVADGVITIICQFNSFSTDTGCTVQLVLQGTSTVKYTATFNRTGSIAEGSIRVMSGGVYDILAFDEGSPVLAASLLGLNITRMIQSTTTTTSIITSTSTYTSIIATTMPATLIHISVSVVSPTITDPVILNELIAGLSLLSLAIMTAMALFFCTILCVLTRRLRKNGKFDSPTCEEQEHSVSDYAMTKHKENSENWICMKDNTTQCPMSTDDEHGPDKKKTDSSKDDNVSSDKKISIEAAPDVLEQNLNVQSNEIDFHNNPVVVDQTAERAFPKSEYQISRRKRISSTDSTALLISGSTETIYTEKMNSDKNIPEDEAHSSTGTNKNENIKLSIEQKPVQTSLKLKEEMYADLKGFELPPIAPLPQKLITYIEVVPHNRVADHKINTRVGKYDDPASSTAPLVPPRSLEPGTSL